MLPATFAANIIVSGLIAARLLYAQRLLTTTMPNCSQEHESESPYMSALAICVESSALIALLALVSLITTNVAYGGGTNTTSYPAGLLFPIIILPQVCVSGSAFFVRAVCSAVHCPLYRSYHPFSLFIESQGGEPATVLPDSKTN